MEMTQNRDHYAFLSDAALDHAQANLSWETWAHKIVSLARNATYHRYESTDLERGRKAALGGK